MLAPGATIGILGGGQLGRMTAMAAARLGYRTHVFSTVAECPAAQVANQVTTAEFEDTAALDRFGNAVDVVTYETENIPLDVASRLDGLASVIPGPAVLSIAQDRLREKDFIRSIDLSTTAYREVSGPDSLKRAMRDIGQHAVLKSVRMGYDGKSQVMIGPETDPAKAWVQIGSDLGILEALVDFRAEISVIVCRTAAGTMVKYPAVENQHVNHILDTTIAPARIEAALAMRAEAIARHIAEKINLVGVVCVEMFLLQNGEILINELAPRPHNSGHWTIDACYTSQFEQLVRIICGLPVGMTESHSDAVMRNIIGADVEKWRDSLADPMVKLHLYGKTETRPGRKMGHTTRLLARR